MNWTTSQVRELIEGSIYPLLRSEFGNSFQLYFVQDLGYGIISAESLDSQDLIKIDCFCWICNELLSIGNLGMNYYDPKSDLTIYIATKVSQFIKLELLTASSLPSLYSILFEACVNWVGDTNRVRSIFAALAVNLEYEVTAYFTIPHEMNNKYKSCFEEAIEICKLLSEPSNILTFLILN
jgi:hypothetical protein